MTDKEAAAVVAEPAAGPKACGGAEAGSRSRASGTELGGSNSAASSSKPCAVMGTFGEPSFVCPRDGDDNNSSARPDYRQITFQAAALVAAAFFLRG